MSLFPWFKQIVSCLLSENMPSPLTYSFDDIQVEKLTYLVFIPFQKHLCAMKMQVPFPDVLTLHGRQLPGQDLTGTSGWKDRLKTFAGRHKSETNSDLSMK